jgi:hypothetical protein
MTAIQALTPGLVQGLTEFLPISSIAHLRVIPALLGWPDPGAAFSAVLQLGTLAAVLVYFGEDLWSMARAAARISATRRPPEIVRPRCGAIPHGRRRPCHGLSPAAVASPAGASPPPGFGSGPPVDRGPRRGASGARPHPRSPATALGPVPTGGWETSPRPACRDVGTGAQAPHIAPHPTSFAGDFPVKSCIGSSGIAPGTHSAPQPRPRPRRERGAPARALGGHAGRAVNESTELAQLPGPWHPHWAARARPPGTAQTRTARRVHPVVHPLVHGGFMGWFIGITMKNRTRNMVTAFPKGCKLPPGRVIGDAFSQEVMWDVPAFVAFRILPRSTSVPGQNERISLA